MDPELEFDDDLLDRGRRGQLIEQAAIALDRLEIQMGPGGEGKQTDAGDFARAFAEDVAEVQKPQIYRLDPELIDRTRTDVPVGTDELVRDSRFYWLSLPVSLWSRPGWGFNRLDVKAVFGAQGGATTFDLLPDQEFATRFKANAKVALGVDAGMRFHASLPTVSVGLPGVADAGADAAAKAELSAETGLVVGPFEYAVTAPKVKHSPPGLDHAFWRLDGAQYVDERDPGLRIVLRVPKPARDLTVTVTIQARRYFAVMNARFQEAVQNLPSAIANFFRNGTPLGDSETWELTEAL